MDSAHRSGEAMDQIPVAMFSPNDGATQPEAFTQQMEKKVKRSVSGLAKQDVADVICILHPASVAAFRIVQDTARRQRQHILQRNDFLEYDGPSQLSVTEAETLLLENREVSEAQDLALRFSSHVNNPAVGFCFGRNLMKCDINLDPDHKQNRISNTQFRIFCNASGIAMLEDMSTNGTIVDKKTLGGKRHPDNPKMQMLNGGSIIEILSMNADEVIKFIVRIPSREPHQAEYIANFQNYMQNLAIAEERNLAAQQGPPMPDAAVRGLLAAPLAGPANTKKFAHAGMPIMNTSNYGMKWDGGDEFNCVGVLGKGAFATVYQLATKTGGELYAAKELEKRRFIKNGQLDQRLDNEMHIMKDLRHQNIVQYIDYIETDLHLYIIMEYIPCGDLQGYMQSHGTLPEDMGREMSRQIFDALTYLHERSITHRDIKPDNILIQSEQPFVVKLTDFGLSKVVKNNETFLKTFCGTLLYCAPEVFPDWHRQPASRQRPKRRAPGNKSLHSYSQLVDIWSYAAVLWFVMCGRPPFEGVTEGGGRGMFNKIMNTPLDTTPLEQCGISDDAIDLLQQMLHTDPATRPSELDCLRHPWLNGGTQKVLYGAYEGLVAITEDNEMPTADDELDASQLKLEEQEEGDFESSPDELQNEQPTKRAREAGFRTAIRPLARQDAVIGAQEASWQSVPLMMDETGRSNGPQGGTAKPPKLFGEISQRALRSSGVLGGPIPLPMPQSRPSIPDTEYNDEDQGSEEHADVEMDRNSSPYQNDHDTGKTQDGEDQEQEPGRKREQHANTTSLNGAESMVREMHMTSPDVSGSQADTSNGPSTPKTPTRSGDLGSGRPSQASGEKAKPLGSQEQTPKAVFNRHVYVPPVPSQYYDPSDKETHNLGYASAVSGINFHDADVVAKLSDRNSFLAATTSMAGLGSFRASGSHEDQENTMPSTAPAALGHQELADAPLQNGPTSTGKLATEPEFKAPLPHIGRLTTTPGSYVALNLPLTQAKTFWGRHPGNQLVYRDSNDTKVPKIAFCIYFYDSGSAESGLLPSGSDGSISNQKVPTDTELVNQWAFVSARSKTPLFVNGIKLDMKDAKGRELYGRLYSGDEITAVKDMATGAHLTFRFEAFAGKSRDKRPQGTPFYIETKK